MTPPWKWAGSLEVGRKPSWPGSDKVLLCIAVHDLLFLIYTCLKCIERGIFYWSISDSSVLDCYLCFWKSHFSHLTALLHFASSASAFLILSWPRWLVMNVLSKQNEAELPLRWVRGEDVGKGCEHPKHKEIIVFSFSTICFPGWWALESQRKEVNAAFLGVGYLSNNVRNMENVFLLLSSKCITLWNVIYPENLGFFKAGPTTSAVLWILVQRG